METLVRWSKQGMILILVGLVFITALALGMYFIVIQPAANQQFHGAGQGSGLVKATGPRDSYQAQSGPVFLVPSDAVPKTQSGRAAAPSSALLPDRWASNTNADAQVGPGQDTAQIPASDRRQLISAVQSFLTLWETFTPPDVGQSLTAPQAYVAKLAPWADSGALSNIANRVDNAQGGDVCPDAGCTVGSSFVSTDLWDGSNVRYYNGQNAYVTAFGDVTYTATTSTNPLDGVTFQRSYGLLLQLENGRWLVTRAAAASNGVVP